MVFEAGTGRLIHRDVICVEKGAYDSAEGARKAGQARAQVRAAERRLDEAHSLMSEAAVQRVYDSVMPAPERGKPPASKVARLVPQPVSTRPAEDAPGLLPDAEVAKFRRRLDEKNRAKRDAEWG